MIEEETVKVGVVFRVDSDLIRGQHASQSENSRRRGHLRMQYQFRIFPYQALRDRAAV